MSNELLGQIITVNRMNPVGPGFGPSGGSSAPVPGYNIIHDYLGFNNGWQVNRPRRPRHQMLS